MLDELLVENLGIIESARIEPGAGLVAVTGETGTGKTLLLGAIRLLRGETARADRVGPHGDEARVEGRFVGGGGETVVTRRFGGRSRTYLDGEMVPARTLADRVDDLIEVVAQHEHVSLGREASVRAMIDGLLDADGRALRASYGEAWRRLAELRAERDAAGSDPMALARDLDLARHQVAEIDGAGLIPGEDGELRDRLSRSRHAEEITAALVAAVRLLEGEGAVTDQARNALGEVRTAADLDPTLAPLATQLDGAIVELDEVARAMTHAAESVDHDPAALHQMEERAAVIADLRRKYGASVDEVLTFADELRAKVERLQNAADRAGTIAEEIEQAAHEARRVGAELGAGRRLAADRLTGSALDLLRQLGFSAPHLTVEFTPGEPAAHGCDRMHFMFASDESLTPGPAARVASGGELSRLVLALRVAAGVADADVIAFDEIDAGVGGTTALAMGELLARLAVGRQVMVVTHLPQIAAFADTHFVVDRDGHTATVRRVDGDERLAELTRMLGGLGESEHGRLHAAELLETAGERRRGS